MKRPGIPFFIAGVVFLVMAIATGDFSAFLTIGIALIVVGMLFQRRSKKSK